MRPAWFIGLIITLLGSCQSPQKLSSGLEENFDCEWNNPRTFQLCLTQAPKESFPRPITYEIFDKAGNLIRNGKIRAGYVRWIGNTDVELFEAPGMMPKCMTQEDLVRVYRIRYQDFISKKEYLNLKKKERN